MGFSMVSSFNSVAYKKASSGVLITTLEGSNPEIPCPTKSFSRFALIGEEISLVPFSNEIYILRTRLIESQK